MLLLTFHLVLDKTSLLFSHPGHQLYDPLVSGSSPVSAFYLPLGMLGLLTLALHVWLSGDVHSGPHVCAASIFTYFAVSPAQRNS